MWFYNNEEFKEELIEKNAGFVYVITNTVTGMKYIGKKLFKHRRNKKLIESDWRTYYGSNDNLLRDVKILRREFILEGNSPSM